MGRCCCWFQIKKRGAIPLMNMATRNQHWGKSGTKKWKHHRHLLERKKGQMVINDHSEWSIHHNFAEIHNEVYSAMKTAGEAEKLLEPLWVDEKQQ
jgi:hypothetical protein